MSNDPGIKTPMFQSQRDEDPELRKTTKWTNLEGMQIIQKSDEDTEHFRNHRKDESMLDSVQKQSPQLNFEEVNIQLSDGSSDYDEESMQNSTSEN
jgi:hypothetical protein